MCRLVVWCLQTFTAKFAIMDFVELENKIMKHCCMYRQYTQILQSFTANVQVQIYWIRKLYETMKHYYMRRKVSWILQSSTAKLTIIYFVELIMKFHCMKSILVWFLQSFTTKFATKDFVHFFAIRKRFLLQLVAHDT